MKSTGTYYNTFAGRSRSASAKTFYGLTATQIEKLKLIRSDTANLQRVQSRSVFMFATIYIDRARDLARSGQKDSARNWYRFFSNSQIVALLGCLPCDGDLKKLAEDLAFLGLECHPLDVPSFETDLEAIRDCLTEILSHVKKAPRKTQPVRRVAAGRAARRPYGRR